MSKQARGGRVVLDEEYEVERIVKRRLKKKGSSGLYGEGQRSYEYLIKWKGYSLREATWEPRDHLTNIEDDLRYFDREMDRVTKSKKKKPKKELQPQRTPRESKGDERRKSVYIQLESDDDNVASQEDKVPIELPKSTRKKSERRAPKGPKAEGPQGEGSSNKTRVLSVRRGAELKYEVLYKGNIYFVPSQHMKRVFAKEVNEFYEQTFSKIGLLAP